MAESPSDTGLAGAPPRRRRRSRSTHLYASTGIAFALLAAWGIGRLTVCWGSYQWRGIVLCHSHVATGALLLAGCVVFGLLVRDLARANVDLEDKSKLRHLRAGLRGYRSLERREFVHVTTSSVLLVGLIAVFVWLYLFSQVRF